MCGGALLRVQCACMKEHPSPYKPEDIERVFGDTYPREIERDLREAERRIREDQAELDGGVDEDREAQLLKELEINRRMAGEIGTRLKRTLAKFSRTST